MSAVIESPKGSQPDAVGRAGSIMVVSLLLSRVLGLLRDTVIASHFGLRASNDSYRIANQIPDLVFMLVAGGGLSSAFIPVFAEFWHTNRRKEAWRVFSVVVTVCSLGALALIGIAWMIAPIVVARYGRDKSPEVVADALLMSRIMLPAQFAFLIGSIFLGTLYARKQFLVPGMAPNIYNVGIIVGAALLPGIFGFGIIGVAWGALAGAYIGNLIIPALVVGAQGARFRPSLDVRAPGVAQFFKLLLPVIVGFSLPSMVNLVTQYFASPYGEGSNTVLTYSNNLMQAPLGIFGQSLALAAFPVLAEFFAQNRMELYRSQVSKTLRTVLYLCIPSSVLMFAMAPLIVRIIYGYGKAANNPEQLQLIASCLRIYCVAIAAWCVQPVLMRGFFSMQKTFKPIALGTGMTGVFILLCVGAGYTSFGIFSLPWATNLAAVALVIILYLALEKDVGRLDRIGIARTIARSGVSAIPLGLIAYGGGALYVPSGKLAAIGWFFLVACLAGWAYYFVTRWFRMPETAYVERATERLRRR